MQIQEMLGRYNSNIKTPQSAQGAEGTSLQKGSSIQSLSVGTVFEGTVGKLDGDKVQLLLGNGQTVNARLGMEMALFPGQSMFFEVASKDQNTVAIKPFQQGDSMGNPTLMTALDAAGMKADEANLRMVDTMMKEGMPIDKNSLNEMAKLLRANSEIDQTTLIQMKKLDLPLTKEMAAQFENYKTDSHQILKMMDEVLSSATEALGEKDISGREALKLNDRLVKILSGEDPAASEETGALGKDGVTQETAKEAAALPGKEAAVLPDGKTQSPEEVLKDGKPVETAVLPEGAKEEAVKSDAAKVQGNSPENSLLQDKITETAQQQGEVPKDAARLKDAKDNALDPKANVALNKGPETENTTDRSLRTFLSSEDLKNLEQQIKDLDKDGKFPMKELKNAKSAQDFAKALNEFLQKQPELPEEPVKKLLSGKEYLKILKEVTRDQWSIRPEQFSEDKVKSFYENLDRQMKQTESVLREMGMKESELSKSVSDLRSNLEFMNEINQTYTYLQMPIRFQNQNANGDLYVYTNKKNLADKDGELTAFLHFDMDNLGSTDISVRMKDRDVSTKFYLEDDASYNLILEHAPELQKRLERKGYSCKIEAVNEEKEVNFVDDFLKAEAPSGGVLHRYSFDMKA